MDLKGIFNFPYQFLIEDEGDNDDVCQEWCVENCKGMWLITGRCTARLYSPAAHKSLFVEEVFPPTSIIEYGIFIVSFQEEDEAMAFKLSFEGDKK